MDKRKILIIVLFILTTVHLAFSIYKITSSNAPDFSVYYYAALGLRDGISPYANPSLFTGVGYPPVTVAAFVPLSYIPYDIAQSIWVAGNGIAVFICVGLSLVLIRRWSIRHWMVGSLLFYWSFPTRFTIGMGQDTLVSLFLLLIGLLYVKRKPWTSTIAFLFATIFKPHLFPILLVMTPIFPRVTGITIALYGICTSITIGLLGLPLWVTYFQKIAPALLVNSGPEMYYNQGIRALVSRLIYPELTGIVSGVLVSAVIFIALYIFIKSKWRFPDIVFCMIPLVLLAEPLSWQHHGVLLLPVFLYLWFRFEHQINGRLILVLAYGFISWNFPDPNMLNFLPGAGIVLSHMMIGTGMVFGLTLYTMISGIHHDE